MPDGNDLAVSKTLKNADGIKLDDDFALETYDMIKVDVGTSHHEMSQKNDMGDTENKLESAQVDKRDVENALIELDQIASVEASNVTS